MLAKAVASGAKPEQAAKTPPAEAATEVRDEILLAQVANILKIPIDEIAGRIEGLLAEVKQLTERLAAASATESPTAESLLDEATETAGVKVVVAEVPAAGPQVLRQLIDQLRRKAPPIAVLLGSRQGDAKVMLVAGISRELVEKGLSAGDWVKQTAPIVGGGGGGRPDMAQAGGKLPEKLSEALDAARTGMEELLS